MHNFTNILDNLHYLLNGKVLSATCECCKQVCDTNNPTGGIGDNATTFYCQKCSDLDEALWEASDMMRDVREQFIYGV